MLSTKRYHFKAAALPLALAIFLGIGSLYSCSENPSTGGKDSCDTCQVPCDTCEVPCDTCDTTKPPCDTCGIDKDSAAHAFVWTQYTIPGESNLTGAYVSNDTEIFVIGTYLYRFNGVSWKKIDVRQQETGRPLAFPDFTMFGLGPSDLWMVSGGSIIDHYIDMGYDWANEFRSISAKTCWGTSSTDMFFVAVSGQIHHFDGTTFTKMASPTTKRLYDVWGTSHNDVWATGYNSSTDESVLLHYDGVSWTEDEFSTSNQTRQFGIGSVWACDSAGHKVSVISGTRVFRKTDNGIWRKDSAEIGNSLGGGTFIGLGIRGNNANDLMTVGGWGFVSHWNGKTWHKYKELYNYGDATFGPQGFSMKENTACVVGGKSTGSWIAIGRRKPF